MHFGGERLFVRQQHVCVAVDEAPCFLPRHGKRALALVISLLLFELEQREVSRGIVDAQPHLAARVGAHELFGIVAVMQRVEVQRPNGIALQAVVGIGRNDSLEFLCTRQVDKEFLLFTTDNPQRFPSLTRYTVSNCMRTSFYYTGLLPTSLIP